MAARIGRDLGQRGAGDEGPRRSTVRWQRGLRCAAGGAMLWFVAVGGPQHGAFAAGVVGTGTPESCTEAALDAALADGGMVTFDCGPAPVTITVTTAKRLWGSEATVDGGGLITLSGGNKVRVFSVLGGALTLKNLTIADGRSSLGLAGGVFNSGGTLVVTHCTFANNSAAAPGGAIYNEGELTVTDSTFTGNEAKRGGGVQNLDAGPASVTNCRFSDNDADEVGGGINNQHSTMTVTASIFSGNHATAGGAIGHIDPSGRTLSVATSTISGNSADGGGGIYNESGVLTVTDSIFSDNSAIIGGAIDNNLGTLSVTTSTLAGNSASWIGGGVFTSLDATCAVRACTVANNYADDAGGGIYNEGGLTVTNSTLAGNTAFFTGGAIHTHLGTLSLITSTISGNGADSGGGILVESGMIAVSNTIIANSRTGGDCTSLQGPIVPDGSHNLIEDASSACGLTNDVNGNIVGVAPMLDPVELHDNGGPTQTVALLAGSPAINAGDDAVCAGAPVNNRDQRGYVRPGTGATHCSIGAYEFNSPGPPPSCAGDCKGDGAVTIDELITLVNIALDAANVSACAAGDANGDGAITINEVVIAVNAALNGCPARMCGGIAGLPCGTGEVCDLRDPTCAVADLAGTCVPGPLPCPSGGDPVCGCDRVTYANECSRVSAQATLAHTGACAGGS